MSSFLSILFWSGIALLADGALGLIFEERWSRLLEKMNVRRFALIELGVALLLLGVHFFLRSAG